MAQDLPAGAARPDDLPTAHSPEQAIRLLAVDLDGTLLSSDKKISGRTLAALQSLREKDVKVVLATARPPRSVRHIYEAIGLDTYTINYNGALIWDEPKKRAAFHLPMAGEMVLDMIETARDQFDEVLVSCEAMDKWFTDRDDHTHTTETGRLFKPDLICECSEFCKQPITKLMLLGDKMMLMRIEALLVDKFADSVNVLYADENLLQIMDKRAGKASALKRVIAGYGISRKQVMAIGDAPNDVGMMQIAGVPIAVGNAHPMVKRYAQWVAPTNDDHGVYATLVRYGLCSPT